FTEAAHAWRLSLNRGTRQHVMYIQRRHWLDYDPVALAVLVIGIGIIELLALIIWPIAAVPRRASGKDAPMGLLELGSRLRADSANCRGSPACAGLFFATASGCFPLPQRIAEGRLPPELD